MASVVHVIAVSIFSDAQSHVLCSALVGSPYQPLEQQVTHSVRHDPESSRTWVVSELPDPATDETIPSAARKRWVLDAVEGVPFATSSVLLLVMPTTKDAELTADRLVPVFNFIQQSGIKDYVNRYAVIGTNSSRRSGVGLRESRDAGVATVRSILGQSTNVAFVPSLPLYAAQLPNCHEMLDLAWTVREFLNVIADEVCAGPELSAVNVQLVDSTTVETHLVADGERDRRAIVSRNTQRELLEARVREAQRQGKRIAVDAKRNR